MTYNSTTPLVRSSRIDRPSMPAEPVNDGPTAVLRTMAVSVREHRLTLIVSTIVGIVLAGLYAHSLPQVYTSAATLLLEPRRQAAASGWETVASQALDLNRADSELQVIRSERLLKSVFDSLDLQNNAELADPAPGWLDRFSSAVMNRFMPTGGTRADNQTDATRADEKREMAFANFSQRLTARRVGQSYAIEIEYASKDPALAARVANSAASAYILQSVAYKAEIAKTGTEFLQGRIDSLAKQVAIATDAMKQGTPPQAPTPDADGRLIGAAQLPLSPSSPRTKLIIAFGGVVGLIIGIALIGRAVVFDRKVRTSKKLAQQTGIPCIGILPEVPKWKGLSRRGITKMPPFASASPTGNFTRAIRDLHTSIDIASPVVGNQGVVIAATSWEPDTGVSTLCINLAQLVRRSGRHVTMFTTTSFDDGPPTPKSGPDTPAWLKTIIASEPAQKLVAYTRADGVAIVPILGADVDVDHALDFRNPTLRRIIDQARSVGDVFLDLPPLSQSADGLALAQLSDLVVVVARAGTTTHDEVNDAIDQLLRARTNVVGTVINRAIV